MARIDITNWLNIDLSSLTSNNKNDIVVELKGNGYRNFLQQKLMPTDSATRLASFETTLNNILNNLPNYPPPTTVGDVLGSGFYKIRQLCDGKEGMTQDLVDNKINQELSLIDKNVQILNLLETKKCLLLRNFIMTNCGLSNAYLLCNNLVYNGKKITDLLMDNLYPDLSSIDADLTNLATETNKILKNKAKDRMLTVVQKYLQHNLLELHQVFLIEEKSVHTKASIGGFSVELPLKLLYSLCNIDGLIEKNYLQILEYKDETEIVDDILDAEWMKIKDNNKLSKIAELERLKRNVSLSNVPVGVNGHTLFSILEEISNSEIRTFIKYKIMTISSVLETRLMNVENKEEYVSAEDLMLLLRDFDEQDAKEQFKKIKTDIFSNSNVFDGKRYSLNDLKDENLRFIISFAYATYIALNHEYNRQKNQNGKVTVPADFNTFEKLYSENLNELINNNLQKKEVLLELCNNLSPDNQQKMLDYLTPISFYELIKCFSYNEIKDLLVTVNEETSFKDVVYYVVFLKTYINEISLNLDSTKFARINKLFETIRNTNDFTQLGHQFSDWFYSIRIEELTPEEFEIIDKIDPKYVNKCLNYRNKIIYEKCKDKNVKFSYMYEMHFDIIDDTLEIFGNKFQDETIPSSFLWIINQLKYNLSDELFRTVLDILKEENLSLALNNLMNIPLDEKIKKGLCLLKTTAIKLNGEISSSWIACLRSQFFSNLSQPFDVKFNLDDGEITYVVPPQELNDIPNLILETGLSLNQIKKLYTLYRTNKEIKNISFWLKQNNLSLEQIATKCGHRFASDPEYYYGNLVGFKEEELPTNLTEKTINQINDIPYMVKKTGLSMWSIIELYRFELTKEQIESIPELSEKTGLLRTEIKGLICNLDGNYDQAVELCQLLEKDTFIANFNMKLNNIKDLVKIIKLIGCVGDYIFYKTPDEVEEYIKLCQEKGIDFNPRWLYLTDEEITKEIENKEFDILIRTLRDNGVLPDVLAELRQSIAKLPKR